MKKILVPTDFSEEAENAVEVAAMLAKQHDAEIYLLHLLELPMQQIEVVSGGGGGDLPEAIYFMKMARKQFEELLDKPYLKDVTVYDTVDFDISFADIPKVSKEKNIDMIVMGSHGASGFKEMFIGSNAEKVVRHAKVPVLVVKNKHTSFDIKNFVFASDFKKDNKETYKQAIDLAEGFGAKLHLVLVNTAGRFLTTEKANQRINDFIKDYSFDNYTVNIYNDNNVETGILNFSKSIDADLIGISTHGRQGIAHFFNGSISEDLVNHANRPVITFKI